MTATTTITDVAVPDFADVYAEHLEPVWRFVRSRMPDHHEAHDVTSDVFVRAWRNWDRFEPARGAVLGTSVGAAKMTIHRSIERLRSAGLETTAVPKNGPPADLEAVIDGVLGRAHDGHEQSELRGLLLAVASLHRPPMPPDLSSHVSVCVQCAAENDVRDPVTNAVSGRTGAGARLANTVAALLAFMGVCLVCTVPALQTLALALGVWSAMFVVHYVGIAATPLVLWLVHRGMGATTLLVVGAMLNVIDTQRWWEQQAVGLRGAAGLSHA